MHIKHLHSEGRTAMNRDLYQNKKRTGTDTRAKTPYAHIIHRSIPVHPYCSPATFWETLGRHLPSWHQIPRFRMGTPCPYSGMTKHRRFFATFREYLQERMAESEHTDLLEDFTMLKLWKAFQHSYQNKCKRTAHLIEPAGRNSINGDFFLSDRTALWNANVSVAPGVLRSERFQRSNAKRTGSSVSPCQHCALTRYTNATDVPSTSSTPAAQASAVPV